jgi:hypothetical protein
MLGAGFGYGLGDGLEGATPLARALLFLAGAGAGGTAGYYGAGPFIGKPLWEQEQHDDEKKEEEKRGFLNTAVSLPLGTGLGALYGAARGNTPEGVGRGVIRGLGAGLGGDAGMLAGIIAAALTGGGPNEVGQLSALGSAAGQLGGYGLAGQIMGEAPGDAARRKRDEERQKQGRDFAAELGQAVGKRMQ